MEEVGGALKGVRSGSDARESVALGLAPQPATWLTLAFLLSLCCTGAVLSALAHSFTGVRRRGGGD